jgi:hypothetical protein
MQALFFVYFLFHLAPLPQRTKAKLNSPEKFHGCRFVVSWFSYSCAAFSMAFR